MLAYDLVWTTLVSKQGNPSQQVDLTFQQQQVHVQYPQEHLDFLTCMLHKNLGALFEERAYLQLVEETHLQKLRLPVDATKKTMTIL